MTAQERDARQGTLSFLLGAAGTGKTAVCLARLRERESAGQQAFYLVPEQSTYLADREILDPRAGLEAVRHIHVLSFRRLAHFLDEGPDAQRRLLDPPVRRLIVRNLLQDLERELLVPFRRVLDRPGFTEAVVQALRELRHEGGPTEIAWLDASGRRADLPEDLRRKVMLLSALRTRYEALLRDRGLVDPDLLLADAPSSILAQAERFRGREILVDGYLSFTRLEAEMLVALAVAGAHLTIALCCEPGIAERAAACPLPSPPGFRLQGWPRSFLAKLDRPVFLGPARTFLELVARFGHAGWRAEIRHLPDSADRPTRFAHPLIRDVERRALQSATRSEEPAPAQGPPAGAGPEAREQGIPILVARDPAHEVEIWARAIDRWIRLERGGARPGEIAVVVRDLEPYRPHVEQMFRRFDIPFFLDRHWDLASRPLARTLLSALEVVRSGWVRDTVISFLRAPLAGSRPSEVDLLENLALEAGFDYRQFHARAWEPILRPERVRFVGRSSGKGDGDEAGQNEPERDDRELLRERHERDWEELRADVANRLRATHLLPLRDLEIALEVSESGGDGVRALRAWMRDAGIQERFLDASAGEEADASREWDSVVGVVDRIGEETASGPLGVDHLVRLLRAGLDSLKLGRTPTGCDQVILAEVQRSRLGAVRYAIVGGLSADQFPRSAATAGLWSAPEREQLGARGLVLGTPEALRQEEEAYFFYIALTRASERLVLTRPASDAEGRSLEPSPYLRDLCRLIPEIREIPPAVDEDPGDLEEVQTPEDLSERVGAYLAARFDRRVSGRTRAAGAGRETLEQDERILRVYNRIVEPPGIPRAARILEQASRIWGYDNRPRLPDALLPYLASGRDIVTSTSRVENFARCPYQHFAGTVLRLRPRPEARVSPLEMGSLAHRVLEELFRRGVPTTDLARVERELDDVYASIIEEETFRAFRDDALGAFRLRSSRRQILQYLANEIRRLEGSPFRPHAFELAFGTKDTPAVRIALDDNAGLLLRGRIDRIDVHETEEGREALIIDYKSRGRPDKGGLRALESGLDLQLAVYMLAAEVLGYIPVAALYMPVLHTPAKEEKRSGTDFKARGLFAEDRLAWISGGTDSIVHAPRGSRIADRAGIRIALEKARSILTIYGNAMKRGRIDIAPVGRGTSSPCGTCDFHGLCRIDPAYNRARTDPREGFERSGEEGGA